MTTKPTEKNDGPGAEVAVPETRTNALALPTDDPWAGIDTGYVGDAGTSEVTPVLPRLMFNANKGFGFIDEHTGAVIGEGENITASWLAWSESRAWWEQPFGKGNKQPSCRSVDMIVPDEGVPLRQAETCAACQWSKFGSSRTEGQGPDCTTRVNVMLWLIGVNGERLPDGGRITRTAFKGVGLANVRRYLGFFASKGVKLPPMSHITTIEVSETDTDFGPKLVPVFHIGDRVDPAEAAPLIEARETFLAEWRSALAEDLADPAAAGDVVPEGVVDTTATVGGAGGGGPEEPF